MHTKTRLSWKPGNELPQVLPYENGGMLAIVLPPEWLKPDRTGNPLLLPPAVRAIDRLRAVFAKQEKITPGFITSLREGMGLTQAEFGQKLGVSKMTISRWERGRMRPSQRMVCSILKLQIEARHLGVKIDGEKRTNRHLPSVHRGHSRQ